MEPSFQDQNATLLAMESHLRSLPPEELRNHTVDGLPTLHYLAKLNLKLEDNHNARLDRIIKLLINGGYDINKTTDNYRARRRVSLRFTALLAAVEQSNFPLLSCLLLNGSRTDVCDSRGYSPLHWAVIVGDQKCLEVLIESGASLTITPGEQPDYDSIHPILHTAVDEGRTGIVYYLLKRNLVDPNGKAMYRDVLTEEAHTRCPSRYNSQPGSLKTKDVFFTPLERAVRNRRLPIIEILLKHPGVKLSGFSELHFCIVEGDTEVACILKDYFSDSELASDKISDTWALHCLHPLAFQDPNRVGKTVELIQKYINAGWNVNSLKRSLTVFNGSELWFRYDQPKTSRWCIEPAGFLQLELVCSLLHLACLYKSEEVIKFLVEKGGADINLKTDGNAILTPLQILILAGEWSSAAYLLEKGADLKTVGMLNNVCLSISLKCNPKTLERVQIASWKSTLQRISRLGLSCSFNAVELLIRLGHPDGLPLLTQILGMELQWDSNGKLYYQLALEGANPDYVFKVLNRCGSLSMKDITWFDKYTITRTRTRMSDRCLHSASTFCDNDVLLGVIQTPVPSFYWLLVTIKSIAKRGTLPIDCSVLPELLKQMVAKGYDCNLMGMIDVFERVVNPLLIHALQLDFELGNNTILTTILEFNHVNPNLRDEQGRNGVDFVIRQWHRRCLDGRKCWIVKENGCYETVRLLVTHGADVSEMIIRPERFWYHYGYLEMIKLLYCAGAKIDPTFFNPLLSVCHAGYLGTHSFAKDLEELKVWKEKYDKNTDCGMNLEVMCRHKIRKMVTKIGDLQMLDKIPTQLKEEVIGKVIDFM